MTPVGLNLNAQPPAVATSISQHTGIPDSLLTIREMMLQNPSLGLLNESNLLLKRSMLENMPSGGSLGAFPLGPNPLMHPTTIKKESTDASDCNEMNLDERTARSSKPGSAGGGGSNEGHYFGEEGTGSKQAEVSVTW
ncbi:hypothetical protein pipiens_000165, partial [Culex pipiens pipiens]